MKPLMRRQAWFKSCRCPLFAKESFQQAARYFWCRLPLQTLTVSLVDLTHADVEDVFVVLDLVFWKCWKLYCQRPSCAAVGVSPLKRTSLKKSLQFTVMTNYQQPFKKMTGQQVRQQLKIASPSWTIAEGMTTEIIICVDNSRKSRGIHNCVSSLTELMWPNDCGSFSPPSKYDLRILDTVAYNVARKNKDLALYEIGEVFEQTEQSKEELPSTALPLL